jgi:hypothetical protein
MPDELERFEPVTDGSPLDRLVKRERPPDWENTVLALRNVLTQLDGWQVQRLLESAQAMATEPCSDCERARPFADLCPRHFAKAMGT